MEFTLKEKIFLGALNEIIEDEGCSGPYVYVMQDLYLPLEWTGQTTGGVIASLIDKGMITTGKEEGNTWVELI